MVNGATGGFGSAGVAVALAMGAGKVVATGRNLRSLDSSALTAAVDRLSRNMAETAVLEARGGAKGLG